MTSSTQEKLGAYSTHQRGKEDGRETDARALLSCANRLKLAIEDGGKDKMAYGDAIRHNQKLWTVFQMALCDPDNQLPKHLKHILLNLSRYVDQVSFKAVAAFSPHLLTELIEINRSIATGLAVRPKDEAIQQTQRPPEMPQTQHPLSHVSITTTA